MHKYPFTPIGVAALFQQLYKLDDAALLIEADEISDDLIDWSVRHFEFTNRQIEFLETVNTEFINFVSAQASVAVSNRLSIILNKPDTSGLRETKLIRSESNLTTTALPDGSVEANGELIIEISY